MKLETEDCIVIMLEVPIFRGYSVAIGTDTPENMKTVSGDNPSTPNFGKSLLLS
jgi:hypothetical protein